ncbi:MAG: lactonase family protein [Chitinophagaceae bacterium]|nr:lactonase family protein [Chitinophagaceae bacterium]
MGTYTQSGSYGMYSLRLNTQTGQLSLLDSVKADNPSYLAVHGNGKYVYAVEETMGVNKGSVAVFSLQAATGKMKHLESTPTVGDHPCFIDINPQNKALAVANYTSGTMAWLKLKRSGLPHKTITTYKYEGTGPNKQRQEKPHVHQALFSFQGHVLWVTDLGADKVTAYVTLIGELPGDSIIFQLPPGAGPRHLAVNETGKRLYVLGELNGAVMVYDISSLNAPKLVQTIKADTISKQPGSADIHLSPDGQFLYASNRAQANNLAIYKVDATTGLLTTVGYQPLAGKGPRNFMIDPSGKWLLVGLQYDNLIEVFSRNPQTGLLQQVQLFKGINTPVCLKYVQS